MSIPKHTPIQNTIIGSALDAVLFHTYALLVMASWRHDFKFTDWITQADLERITGLDWSNIKRHTAQLKRAGLIDWSTNGKNGRRFFILEVRLENGAKAQFCAPSSSSSGSSSSDDKVAPLEPAKAQNCALPLMSEVLDTHSWHALRNARIGEPARTRLANLPHVNIHYVRAMAAQARRDGLSTGGLIFRIENDWPAPDMCDHCGQLDGEHTDSCPAQVELLARREAESKLDYREVESKQAHPEMSMAEALECNLALRLADGRAYWIGDVWQMVESELQLQMTSATFNTWLARSHAIRVEDHALVIGVVNSFAKDWLEHRLVNLIRRTVASVTGQQLDVKFIVSNDGQP